MSYRYTQVLFYATISCSANWPSLDAELEYGVSQIQQRAQANAERVMALPQKLNLSLSDVAQARDSALQRMVKLIQQQKKQ